MEFASGLLSRTPSSLISPSGEEVGTLSSMDNFILADVIATTVVTSLCATMADALRGTPTLRGDLFSVAPTRHLFEKSEVITFTVFTSHMTTAVVANPKLQKKALLAAKVMEPPPWPSLNGLRSGEAVTVHGVVSVGSDCTPRQALRIMGTPQRSYPFDWIRSTPMGVLRAMRREGGAVPFSDAAAMRYVSHVPNTNRYKSIAGDSSHVLDTTFGFISSHHGCNMRVLSTDATFARRLERLRVLLDDDVEEKRKRIVLVFSASTDTLCVDDTLVMECDAVSSFSALRDIVRDVSRSGRHDVHCVSVNVVPFPCCFGSEVTNVVVSVRDRGYDTVANELVRVLPNFVIV